MQVLDYGSKMKRVLMITYRFPPVGGSGIQRVSKFAKYLPEYGWKPVILTSKGGSYSAYDPTLMEDVPRGLSIHRTLSLEPMTLKRLARRIIHCRKTKRGDTSVSATSRKGLRTRVNLFIEKTFLIPDAQIGWLLPAVVKGGFIIWKEDVDVICSTGPPFSAHLIGLLLKMVTRRPWIADFRDPWTQDAIARTRWRLRIEEIMEHAVLKHADRVICVSQPLINGVKQKYLFTKDDNRFLVITNGFDGDDFKGLECFRSGHERFVITYVGTVYERRSPESFLKALQQLFREKKDIAKRVQVNFIGLAPNSIQALPGQLGVQDAVRFIDYVPHKRSLEYLVNSDVILLIVSEEGETSEGIFSGKIFEYLRSGRPILALVPPGVAADLIIEARAGIVVHYQDIEGIKEAVYALYCRHETGEISHNPDWAIIGRFDRKGLTGDLAMVLNGLLP
jgi:glycosyltransferase involved in cell wall biosynthesis